MQSKQVKDAPRHWPRCESSFFLVRTSPQLCVDTAMLVLHPTLHSCPTRGMARSNREESGWVFVPRTKRTPWRRLITVGTSDDERPGRRRPDGGRACTEEQICWSTMERAWSVPGSSRRGRFPFPFLFLFLLGQVLLVFEGDTGR